MANPWLNPLQDSKENRAKKQQNDAKKVMHGYESAVKRGQVSNFDEYVDFVTKGNQAALKARQDHAEAVYKKAYTDYLRKNGAASGAGVVPGAKKYEAPSVGESSTALQRAIQYAPKGMSSTDYLKNAGITDPSVLNAAQNADYQKAYRNAPAGVVPGAINQGYKAATPQQLQDKFPVAYANQGVMQQATDETISTDWLKGQIDIAKKNEDDYRNRAMELQQMGADPSGKQPKDAMYRMYLGQADTWRNRGQEYSDRLYRADMAQGYQNYMALLEDPANQKYTNMAAQIRHTPWTLGDTPQEYDTIAVNEQGKGNKVKITEDIVASGRQTQENYEYMTEEEKKVYNILWAKDKANGTNEADRFLELLAPKLNQRHMEAIEAAAAENANKNPVGATLGAIVATPFNLVGATELAAQRLSGKRIDPNSDAFMLTAAKEKTYGTISENIANSVDSEAMKKVLPFLYQTGTSIGESAVARVASMGQGWLSLLMMGAGAATSAHRDALQRGATQDEAAGMALSAGIAEALFEMVSLDSFVKIKNGKGVTQWVKNLLKQGGVEASEEFATEIANKVADSVIMDENSNFNIAVQNYIEQGMTEEQARAQAWRDQGKDILAAAVGGFISGGVSGAYGSAYNDNVVNKQYKEMGKSIAETNMAQPVIDAALRQSETSESHKLATKMQGGQVSNRELGELAFQLMAEGADFESILNNREVINETATPGVPTNKQKRSIWQNSEITTGVNRRYSNGRVQMAARRMLEAKGEKATAYNLAMASRGIESQIKVLDDIGKKFGLDIIVVDSIAYKEDNGYVINSALNGAYDPKTGRVFVALDAQEGALMYVGMHEIAHALKATNEAAYNELDKFVAEYLNGTDKTMDSLIKGQQERFGYTPEEAREEVISNTLPAILADEKMVYKIAGTKFGRRLYNKLTGFQKSLNDTVARLSKLEDWEQIDILKNDIETINKMVDMFEKGMAQREQVSQNENGDIKNSLKINHSDGKVTEIMSVRDISDTQILKYLDLAQRRVLKEYTYIPIRRNTPTVIIESMRAAGLYISDEPMVMQVFKARKAMRDGDNGHGLTKTQLLEIINNLDNPNAMVWQTERRNRQTGEKLPDNLAVFVDYDLQGQEGFAVVEFDADFEEGVIGEGGDEIYHTVVTVFEPHIFEDGVEIDYLDKLLKNENNQEIEIKKGISDESTKGKIIPGASKGKTFDSSILTTSQESQEKFKGSFKTDKGAADRAWYAENAKPINVAIKSKDGIKVGKMSYPEEAQQKAKSAAKTQRQTVYEWASTEEAHKQVQELVNARKAMNDIVRSYAKRAEISQKEARTLLNAFSNGEAEATGISSKDMEAFAKAKAAVDRAADVSKANRAVYRSTADELITGSETWKDKRIPIFHAMETIDRNFVDIAGKEKGAEFQQNFNEPTLHNEAERVSWIKKMYEGARKLNLTKEESVLVQMLGENVVQRQAVIEAGYDINKLDKAVEWYRKQYKQMIDTANGVMMSFGYAPVSERANYFPHFNSSDADPLAKVFKSLGIEANEDNVSAEVLAQMVAEKDEGAIRRWLRKMFGKDMANEVPTEIAGKTDTFKPGKQFDANFLARRGNRTMYDAELGFERYVQNISNVIFHTEDIQRYRQLESALREKYSDAGIQEELEEIRNDGTLTEEERDEKTGKILESGTSHLSGLARHLMEYTNLLAGKKSAADRTLEADLGRQVYTTAQRIAGAAARSAIGFNISSALSNSISLAVALPAADGGTIRGGINMLKALKKDNRSEYIEKFDFLRRRFAEQNINNRGFMRKLDTASGALMQASDWVSAVWITNAFYESALKQGMSEQDAVAYANEWAAKSMGDRSKGATPTIFERKSPVWKAFTMFQLEVNNQFRFLFKDLPRAAKKRGKAWLAFTFGKELFAALLINLLFEKLTGRKPAFSPVDMGHDVYKIWSKKEVATSEKVKQTAEEMLQELPFIGSLFGGSRIFALSGLPDVATLAEAGGDIIDASKSERNAETQEDEDAAKLAKQQAWGSFGTEAARWASYLPVNVNAFGGQVSKSIKGAKSVGQGAEYMSTSKGDKLKYTVDQDATNWIKALLFGKYAVKESTQYYDSGSFAGDLLNYISGNGFSTSQKGEGKSFAEPNKPLSVADTRRYKEVTESKLMTGTEFIGVVTQINKQESDKDKNGETIEGSKAANIANVIDVSGLNDKQKEYLYQNYVLTKDDREKLAGTNISAQDYYTLKSTKPDYENGKAVENSQTEKIIDAVDTLGLKGKDERDAYKMFVVDEDGQKKASKAGVSVVQYYEITHIEGDKNYDGTSVSGSKSRKVAEYIDAMPSGNKSNLYLEFVLSDTQAKKYEELDGIITPQDVYNIMSITATPGKNGSGANKKRDYIYGLNLSPEDEELVFEAFDVSPKYKRETKSLIRAKKADYEEYWAKAKDIGVSKETFTKVFEEALDMTDKEYKKDYWKIIDQQKMSISMKKALRGIFD